jgi:transcriptional regulator with XRE-family HTH domain
MWSRPGSASTLPAMHFGREVRRRREAAKLTLEKLAERSGLTPNYIGSLENGGRDPSLTTILKLAKGLRVPPGEMLGGVHALSPTALEAARLFEEASPEIQEGLLHVLRALRRRRGA